MIRPADAGRIRHRLTLQRRDSTIGSRGQKATTFSDVATMRAAVETLSGREAEQARRLFASATLKVTTRYIAGVTVEDRFALGDRVLNIGHVHNWRERNEWLIILCAETR